MSRPSPPHGHLLACSGGSGQVLVDGQWQTCAAGQAYLSPAHAPMAFQTVGKHRWQFAWAYFEAPESPLTGSAAYVVPVDPRQFTAAIEGLYREMSAGPSELTEHWAHLVVAHAKRMIAPTDKPDPLWPLWARVDAHLAEPWTLQQLADDAAMAPEALRRLCHRTIGRSPMRQVLELRMRRAQTLLESTPAKIYNVARQVGYQNVFAFSAAFKRWGGKSPSDCRRE
jgi:AraC-like DNA-binding protein